MGDKTSLRLYNTLTRTKEVFAPIDPSNVRMYVCGPTVYDFAHIGNARPVIVFDLLFRLLRHLYGAEHVTYVRNITDVDDKINARAVRDFPGLPLNEAIRKVTETTAAQYQKDTLALGALEPTVQPRATDNIPQMQSLITSLIGSRHAYEAAGEVLFDVSSMPDYGKLSGRNLDENLAGARIAVDAHKKNPADFVLWKQSSAEEPGWDSPWGRGRPGWHIECSAMSERYLGPIFDIHAGGLDLIFPHHENEIAQSRCAHGTPVMANYWLHNGFLQVEGQKMSKSLGNFYSIHQLLETSEFGGRRWSGRALRLAMLMTHYRQPIDWTSDQALRASAMLAEAAAALQPLEHGNPLGVQLAWDSEPIVNEEIVRCLVDDLNTSAAIQFVHSQIDDAVRGGDLEKIALAHSLRFLGLMEKKVVGAHSASVGAIGWGGVPPEKFMAATPVARTLQVAIANNSPTSTYTSSLSDLGFEAAISPFGRVDLRFVAKSVDPTVEELVQARLTALNTRDFAKADQIRNDLLAQGIQLMDYKDESGQRQTKWEVKR